jgi:hypothetical protein
MTQLASEKQSANIKRKIMFNAFWLINATATFLFGLEFVGVVFVGIYALLPIQLSTAQTLAAVTGGIASLAVLDVAYRGWQWQQMNTAETMPQVVIAWVMGWFSFLLSCAYSALVLVLSMPLFGLTTEQTAWVHMFGGVSFIVITIAHLLAAVTYEQASISYKEQSVLVNMSANRETERLDFIEKVQRQALLQTRAQVNTHADLLAGEFQEIWAADLLQASRPKRLQLPPQTARGDDLAAIQADIDAIEGYIPEGVFDGLEDDIDGGEDTPLSVRVPISLNGHGH